MKSVKIIFSILISIFAICPVVASASIINNNGIEITDEEFERFSLAFDDDYIMNLTEEKYERLLDLDFSNVRKETKYILSAYNPHLNIYSEREVSEEEYNLFNLVILNNNSIERDNNDTAWTRFDGGTFHETSSKKITLNVVGGSTYSYVTLTNTWKGMPNTRSYDVIGIRVDSALDVRNGSQSGQQQYYDGSWHMITYAWNGTNINKQNNGYGISMNLVNNTNISELVLTTDCDVRELDSHGQIFGSYQHAVTSVTLAQSKNYTLGGGGLGSVFIFPYNISIKYDGMAGVNIAY